MPRIFISHSSVDNVAARAIEQWLIEQAPELSGEIFLDLDPDTGIAPGTRWKEALRQANYRCEVVICLLSRHFRALRECEVEYRYAETLGKAILGVRLEPSVEGDITREWQSCSLYGDGPTTEIAVPGAEPVRFRTEGLVRLLTGLRRAGVGAEAFVWPPPEEPRRSPYRGWEPFKSVDAAVYFGRDAHILRAMDSLRDIRAKDPHRIFAILGPSGSGKSSFLRAGLIPRIARDDRHFVLLDVLRPARAALTGQDGLAAVIESTRRRLGLPRIPLSQIKSAVTGDPGRVAELFAELRDAAHHRLLEPAESPPTLILPIDQAEELFNADAGEQADALLSLLAHLLADTMPALIVAVAIRTDRYEYLQTATHLERTEIIEFGLPPMPATHFEDAITGPARRCTAAGQPLRFEPALVDRLLVDCADGAGTLPLLALVLARLYTDYAGAPDAVVGLTDYLAIGGVSRVVQTVMDADVLSADPDDRRAELAVLRTAFIPWLAAVDSRGNTPTRRIANWEDLPESAYPLLDSMIRQRLLVGYRREGRAVVEVALESLLRHWTPLAEWLDEQAGDLERADALERAAEQWERGDHDDAWLLDGSRLADAEKLLTRTVSGSGCARPARWWRHHDSGRTSASPRRSRGGSVNCWSSARTASHCGEGRGYSRHWPWSPCCWRRSPVVCTTEPMRPPGGPSK
ncbi:TIR domain-containing protein [Nocardia nova SH22a]|uniref:TIR domain-containing protein n=1 Tax=Nocardia nova SH22a TaxID=1415166 RepID=W5TEI7_9NOCA|nr:toll/interleukin-1 receptor domain-containing protein [Nocardia nova]AHH15661.1 TIR domain-containing protein [Nocardia nova SH22a]